MEIDKIAFNYNTLPENKRKKGDAAPKAPEDTFIKSETMASVSGTALNMKDLSVKAASDVVFSGKSKADLIDPFSLKADNLNAISAAMDPETGTYFTGLNDKGDKQKNFISAFNPDGSARWKTPVDNPPYYLVPDKKGGVITRHENRIFSYDKDGKKNWEFALPDSNKSFDEPPVVGPDNTVFFCTGKENSQPRNANMSIVAVKDGNLQWTYDCGGKDKKDVDIVVTGKGDILFTTDEERKPDSLLQKLAGKKDVKKFLVCLGPDGKKKFEKEVTTRQFFSSHPVEGPDGTLYHISDNGGSFNALTPGGELKWRCELNDISQAPSFDEQGNIYVATGDNSVASLVPDSSLVCLDAKNGEKKWEHNLKRAISASPIVRGDSIYIKVSKEFNEGSKEGFIKINNRGEAPEFIEESSNDGVGLNYLSSDDIVTRTGHYYHNKYQVIPLGSLGKISPESMNGKKDNTGKIELKDDSVVIGGVKLKRGGWLGLFGRWLQ